MKKFLILPLCLVLAACGSAAPPLETASTSNGVQVSLIAVVDGCNLWEIDRGGFERTVYMARCPEGASNVQWDYRSGKATITTQTVAAQ